MDNYLSSLLPKGIGDAFRQYVRDAFGGALNAEVKPQDTLDAAALSLTPVPVVGDVAGLLADGYRYATDPSSRTPLNYSLSALGALPFVPAMGGIVRNKTLEGAAKKHFGRTFDPNETGFILDDATRLDLSGRHYATGYTARGDKYVPKPGQSDYLKGGRNVDHRELDTLVPEGGWDGLARFMNETGAVRYMPNIGISVVDTNMPSQAQIERAVMDFRRSGEPLYVDVDKLNGASRVSEEFQKPTVDAVMEFIRKNMAVGADKVAPGEWQGLLSGAK